MFFTPAITTVEGVLKRTIAGLAQDQPVRKHLDPEGAKQIEEYVAKIEALLTLNQPFHVVRFLSTMLLLNDTATHLLLKS